MAFVDVAVVQSIVEAARVHAHAATLALAAARVNFNRHPVADAELVDARSERRNGAHVLVARCPVLVKRQATLDHRRWTRLDDVEIGGADRAGVDADKDFGALRHRRQLLREDQLLGIAEHPRAHRVWHGHGVVVGLDGGGCVHGAIPVLLFHT